MLVSVSLLFGYSNPYDNLSSSEKVAAITNYLVQQQFESIDPVYPQKPTKPHIKAAKTMVKGMFEKSATFNKRVQTETQRREQYIASVENGYKKEVLAYNKKVKEITDRYNQKIKHLKENIGKITSNAMSVAYNKVYGKPTLSSKDYDADNEIFYAKLTSSRGNFSKNIAIKVPIDMAEKFYYNAKSVKVVYRYDNHKIYLQDIQIPFKGKNYLAMLTDGDFKSSDVKVAISTRELNFKTANLLDSTFKASKSDFVLSDISYGKNKLAKLNTKDLEELNQQRLKKLSQETENLSNLLEDTQAVKKNPKAYAVIFGIEDYMLESNVNYSQNSAMMFMQYANKLLGVPDDNIWAFVGAKTSSGFIKSQWNDFLSLIEPDATVYFYYSGHGVPGTDGNAYILPSDTNAETVTTDKTFMLKNIYSNLSKTKAKKVVAFLEKY